jgi:galactokinase
MSQINNKLKVSAPGRVCLFGEHQDYLGLPVIPCAISLCIEIEGVIRNDLKINIDLPDIQDKESFLIEKEIPYRKERDYFRSGVNILQRENFTFSRGFNCTVRGKIPISSGVSSSSALAVAWIKFLSKMSDQNSDLRLEDIAKYAHRAEVIEFKEPGGMMDHFSSALGNVIFIDFYPEIRIEQIQADLKGFVLGDSKQQKDTKRILSEVKNRVIDITKSISKRHPDFNLHDITVDSLKEYTSNLSPPELRLIKGTIRNHDITKEAKEVLKKEPLDHNRIGQLINEHNDILRDILKITTPKIDRMVEASLEAGAHGAKITGSGGGGCMFAYCSENQKDILDAIEKEGGKGYIVDMDNGVRSEIL